MTEPSKAAHTPGPWFADFHNERRDGGRFITHVLAPNQLVPLAAVPTGVEGFGRDESQANARLIAAAPELLAVAERILERGYVSSSIEEERDDHDALVAAITKARGEA